jgi:YbbR domain-containing protein
MAIAPFRDFSIKLLAVVIALFLWLSVNDERIIERGFQVPLEFENVPATLRISGELPDVVRIRLRGPADVVGGVEPADLAAVLDLADAAPGHHAFDMLAGRVRTPSGVQVTSVAPATVDLALEQISDEP